MELAISVYLELFDSLDHVNRKVDWFELLLFMQIVCFLQSNRNELVKLDLTFPTEANDATRAAYDWYCKEVNLKIIHKS